MTHSTDKDQVFARPLTQVKAFEFDEQVTRVFDDMIARSVPGYDLLLRLIALYTDVFVQHGTNVYDLGCSTGAVSRVVASQAGRRNCRIIGVDNSEPMIARCRQIHNDLSVDWTCADIESIDIAQASLVVLNLTLQFVAPERREELIRRIFEGLEPGGALVLSEKAEFDDPETQQSMTELYQGFKKNQGYSDLEIAQKRSALEEVLIPDKRSEHIARLRRCGFGKVLEIFHCFGFVSYLAVK